MQFHDLLNEEGHLAIVVFGKYCWWETCYYLMKGDVHRAFRRWSDKKSLASLGEGVDQPVYYYSVGRFVRMWRSFRLKKKGAIGLFVPPSYLERAMQRNPRYRHLLPEIAAFLRAQMEKAIRAGVREDKIVIDPGIGFGKRRRDNLAILKDLKVLTSLGRPILIGASRKSFLKETTALPPAERLEASLAAEALAIAGGADIIRVHDVREAVRVASLCDAVFRHTR